MPSVPKVALAVIENGPVNDIAAVIFVLRVGTSTTSWPCLQAILVHLCCQLACCPCSFSRNVLVATALERHATSCEPTDAELAPCSYGNRQAPAGCACEQHDLQRSKLRAWIMFWMTNEILDGHRPLHRASLWPRALHFHVDPYLLGACSPWIP